MGIGKKNEGDPDMSLIPLLLASLKRALLKILAAAFTEDLLLWGLLAIGKVLVKKTTTDQDDKWLIQLEGHLYPEKTNEQA